MLDHNGGILGIDYGLQYQTMNNVGISTDLARGIVESLLQNSWSGSFGVTGVAYTVGEKLDGVWVISVHPGSTADRAGLKPGDIITGLDGKSLANDGTVYIL